MTDLLQRVPDLTFQDLDGEVLVLLPGSGGVLHLNQTASDVWALLEEDTSQEEVAELLARAYEQDVERVRSELAPLLDLLVEQGVVRRVSG